MNYLEYSKEIDNIEEEILGFPDNFQEIILDDIITSAKKRLEVIKRAIDKTKKHQNPKL